MSNTDIVARVLAAYGAVLATAGFILAFMTYRRGQAKLVVNVGRENNLGPERGQLEFLVTVNVANTTLGAVQVMSCVYEVEGKVGQWSHRRQRLGPDLPHKLEGHHAAIWRLPLTEIVEVLIGIDKHPGRIRAVLTLGSGKEVRSKWMTINIHEVAGEFKEAMNKLAPLVEEEAKAPR